MTGAVAEIDLGAIAANWHSLCRLHAPGAVAAVLKADGYGLGAIPIAARLRAEGCRHFFTATLNEAAALQPYLRGATVAVLNGFADGWQPHHRRTLTPVLSNPADLADWRGEPAFVHVDTGMGRLGFHADELPGLSSGAPAFLMTHLVSSEIPDDPMNAAQCARFAAIAGRFPGVPRSFANSSGIFLGAAFASDLARPGAALYGINPTPGRPNPMRPVVRLRARVLQITRLPPGGSVGYNAAWRASRPSRIAVAGIGYADGWSRALSNHFTAYFDGRPVPLVGRVSMDLTTFDATDDERIAPGAWLDLIGPDSPVDAVAEQAGTNAYEVLTSLGARIARTYHG